MGAAQKSYDEIVDLFARGSTPAELLAFRPSAEIQERVRYLLAQLSLTRPCCSPVKCSTP